LTPSKPVALAASQREPNAAHDGVIGCVRGAIAGVHVFQREQRIGRLERLAELERERRRNVQRGQILHPGEHLHAALRLPRLRGLGPEPVDERFQVGALALLLLVLGRASTTAAARWVSKLE
jgi:hypothetical protein